MRDIRGGGYAGRYWKDEVGYDGRGICGTDHLPEIGPAGLPFLVPPPRLQRLGDRNGKRSTSQKKRMIIFDSTC